MKHLLELVMHVSGKGIGSKKNDMMGMTNQAKEDDNLVALGGGHGGW